MSRDILGDILSVGTWKRGDVRAPHKPLLLLLALARIQNGDSRLIPYAELESKLKSLLLDFGPPRQNVRAFYPFWRLQNDGDFWEIPERQAAIEQNSNRVRQDDIPPAVLKAVNAHGGFTEEAYTYLQTHPKELNETVIQLLESHFPPSMHEAILDAIGLDRFTWVVARKKRSGTFRDDVLRLYGRKCAICSYDGRLGVADLALEGAHVMWHSHGGPDQGNNGILLCTLHHKLLDRGAIGISDDQNVLVSQHVSGGTQVYDWITRFAGCPIAAPIDSTASIHPEYILWHRTQVFRDPPLAA